MRTVIIDGQFGSTGKGALAGYLGQVNSPEIISCAFSPNAGHTFARKDGFKMIHKMIPLGITSPSLRAIVFGPGTLIDTDAFVHEVREAKLAGYLEDVSLLVHRNAALVLDRHRDAESEGGTAPGSTRKGCGEAQMERVKRNPTLNNTVAANVCSDLVNPSFYGMIELVDTPYLQRVFRSLNVQIEGCQGYSLSVYHGTYPYCTYRDVSTHSLLADCGVPYDQVKGMTVWGCFRTYPIRVANRPEDGEWSGPCYIDSTEISFEDIGQKQELTTVTKLPRRIFTFSHRQAKEACLQNGIELSFLNFAQYCHSFSQLRQLVVDMEEYTKVALLGFGPKESDIFNFTTYKALKEQYERYHQHS